MASGGSSPDGGLILAEGPSFDLRPFARAADSHEQAELLALALRQMVALAGRPGMTMDRLREQLVRAAEGWERLAAKAREALVHRSVAPFTAACGADEPNQRTTQVAANVTCSRCGEETDVRRRIMIRCGCCEAPWTDRHQCATPCTRHPDHAGRDPGPAPGPGEAPPAPDACPACGTSKGGWSSCGNLDCPSTRAAVAPDGLRGRVCAVVAEGYGCGSLLVFNTARDAPSGETGRMVAAVERAIGDVDAAAYERGLADASTVVLDRIAAPSEEVRERPTTNPAAGPADREALGRKVREIWVEFAREQPNPKPHHLLGWDDLDEPNREVDRRIGERLFSMGAEPALALARILNELVEYGSHLLLHLGQLAEGHAPSAPEAIKAWLDGADLAHAAHFAAQLGAWHGNARQALAPYVAALEAEIEQAGAKVGWPNAIDARMVRAAGDDVTRAAPIAPAEGEEPARGDEVVRVPADAGPISTEAPAAVPAIEPDRKSVQATYGKDDALAYVKAAPASPVTNCPVHPVTAMVAEARHRAHGYPVPGSPPSDWCNASLFGALAGEMERLQARLAEVEREREAAHRALDAHGIPRGEASGLVYSLGWRVGAIVECAEKAEAAGDDLAERHAGLRGDRLFLRAEVKRLKDGALIDEGRAALAAVPAAPPAMPPRLQVGIALISRPRTPDVMEYLVQRRPEDASFGAGLWEFPGGKQEERDHGSFACTVVREAWEELAVGGTVKGDRVAAFDLDPPTLPFPIYVEAYQLAIEGEPRARAASAIEWCTLDEIAGRAVTPATARIADELRRS